MKYDHAHHMKLTAKLSSASAEADKFIAKELKPGVILEPTDFNAMKKAFKNEEQAKKDLIEYLGQFIGPDGRIHKE